MGNRIIRLDEVALARARDALDAELENRLDLMALLQQHTWRLSMLVPPRRRAELARSLQFIQELELSEANLQALITCCRVLEEQYLAESAA